MCIRVNRLHFIDIIQFFFSVFKHPQSVFSKWSLQVNFNIDCFFLLNFNYYYFFLVFFKYFFFEAVGSKIYYLALELFFVNLTDGMGLINLFDNDVWVDIAFSCQGFGNLIKIVSSSSGSFIPLITSHGHLEYCSWQSIFASSKELTRWMTNKHPSSSEFLPSKYLTFFIR